VVRSAIDPQRFCEKDRPRRRLEHRQFWGVDPEETVGLFAAMNYRLKGLEPLLHAVRLLCRMPEYRATARRFRLLVAGHSRFGRYQRLAQKLGIDEQVRFVGHCPDKKNAYFAADFLIHPTFYDPCSLVVLEALACSLPVITTRSNGASELLHPLQEGYVIDDPHKHEHLAWSIGQLLDSERRSACAQAARKAALQWTFDHHFRALVQVFERAAARKQAA
jgi:UDP-glucose:(heptosyl)LPS alpha-1,3-glucosyltransferase